MSDETDNEYDSLAIRSDNTSLSDNLAKSLEALIFLEIAHLYGLDTSLLHILLRTTAVSYVRETSSKHQKLAIVIIVNTICALSHVFSDPPAPSSYGARMLSGGLLVDFIGEYPYTSKLALVASDIFITLIMVLTLLVITRKPKGTTDTTRPDSIPDRELEEGQPESSPENDALVGGDTSDVDANHESDRILRINLRRSFRDITSDTDSRVTTTATRGQEALRRILTAVAARSDRRG